jgi:uncharacterized protein with HEPN domain
MEDKVEHTFFDCKDGRVWHTIKIKVPEEVREIVKKHDLLLRDVYVCNGEILMQLEESK